MRLAFHIAGIAATCCLFPAMLCPQQSPSGLGPGAPSAAPTRARQGFAAIDDSQGGQETARRRAEELAQKALALSQKQTSGDFGAAIILFQESARQFQIAGLPERAAEIYLEIGGTSFILSRYPRALDAYRTGLQLTSADETRCRILARIARTYSIIGRNLEAMRYSGQAVSLCKKLPDPIRAEAYEARGEALYSSSDHSQAIEQFKLALSLFEKNDEARALALLMLAEVRFEEGGKEEGVRLALEALQLWSSRGNDYGVAQARATLGIFSMTAGQFETARCHCEEAQKIFRKVGDEDHRAKALNTLGSTSMGMGDAEAALKYWRQTRTAYARLQDRLGEASAITAMGKALIAMHRYQELPQLFQAELRLARQAASKSMEASALADIAGIEELNSQYQRAESHYLQSVKLYQSLGLTSDEGDILTLLAELYIKHGKYESAISSLELASTIREKNNEVEDEARIGYDLAYSYRKLGRLEDASAAIQKAIPIIERQRSMIVKFDSRASYFAAVHNYYALHINLLMLHHRPRVQDEFAVTAFEASERSKVRSLIDWLVESDQGVSCNALWHRQADEAQRAAPAADSLPGSQGQALSSVTLAQAQALISGDDAILLEYALGDENSYLWAVTENEVRSYELPNAEKLKYLVQRLRKAVTDKSSNDDIERARSEQDYTRYSRQLSQLLLGQVALGGKKRIIFVPEGALQYVPFSALPLRDAHGKSSILADKHEVVILPSASALAAIRKIAENRPRPSLPAAVFANPVFERDQARAQRTNTLNRTREVHEAVDCEKDLQRSRGSEHIPSLPESHREAQAVEQYLGGRGRKVFVAERYQASRKTLLALDLEAYRLLVFSTHTFLDVQHPEQSMILLSLMNQSGAPQNGCVRLSDINRLKLSADLVVLSSCESALGKELASEGIIGLPRSFLRAGARSIIATLWAVDDAATADLMTHFYHHLHLGESPASALRHSQREIRDDKRWSNEYFWAAFVLQGDYRISSLN
jgi:CHAT domain-containing protein/tetratricopeptide (TPR) repeat protein